MTGLPSCPEADPCGGMSLVYLKQHAVHEHREPAGKPSHLIPAMRFCHSICMRQIRFVTVTLRLGDPAW